MRSFHEREYFVGRVNIGPCYKHLLARIASHKTLKYECRHPECLVSFLRMLQVVGIRITNVVLSRELVLHRVELLDREDSQFYIVKKLSFVKDNHNRTLARVLVEQQEGVKWLQVSFL